MVEQLSFEALPEALGIERGIAAVVGSGGKTTTLSTLARLLTSCDQPSQGVVLTTSTHIRPFPSTPLYTGDRVDELAQALRLQSVVCCGTPVEDGKLAAPSLPLDKIAAVAEHVLVEADGSRGLPIKAHAPHEPVIPRHTRSLTVVVGLDGFGGTIAADVHRPERFCALGEARPDDAVTPELVARVLSRELEGGAIPIPAGVTPHVLLTHVETPGDLEDAQRFQASLGREVLAVNYPREALWRIS
ncbi:selenium cofactor biosynthesis protein YqeC [Collinsella sp. An2]|uniref:selenium cofactor biosynthesis protein YqeC n=1 Tax=Collinsella sp. An2 TaxID=1965585 RepID=UPI0013029717|nr:selenium cofactor biosynthesis protein YqeC [Collinsella sp. An2]